MDYTISMKKLFIATLITGFLFMGRASNIYAESSLGIHPPIVEIKAKENAKVSAPITLVNASSKTQEFTIYTRGFDVTDSNRHTPIFYSAEDTPENVIKFLKTIEITDGENAIKDIILYPKETKHLFITFPVTTARQEEYYFSVIFATKPEDKNTDSTRVKSSIGAGILAFTSLNESENLSPEIKSFHANFFHASSPVPFKLDAINTGDSFQNVSGSIHIYNMLGKEAGKIQIKPVIITANTTRSLEAQNGELAWKEAFPLGLYTAKVSISYENAPTVTKEVRFLVLPLLPFLIIVSILIIALGILYRVFKKIQLKD